MWINLLNPLCYAYSQQKRATPHKTVSGKIVDPKNWTCKIFNKEINSIKNQKVFQIFSLDPKK